MNKNNSFTTMRASKKARDIIKRFCSIKDWELTTFIENLAESMVDGIDLLGNPDIKPKTLKEYYGFCDIIVVSDARQIFEPIKAGG